MADKGFTIEDIFPLGISLNTPLFLGMSDQMSAEDVAPPPKSMTYLLDILLSLTERGKY